MKLGTTKMHHKINEKTLKRINKAIGIYMALLLLTSFFSIPIYPIVWEAIGALSLGFVVGVYRYKLLALLIAFGALIAIPADVYLSRWVNSVSTLSDSAFGNGLLLFIFLLSYMIGNKFEIENEEEV